MNTLTIKKIAFPQNCHCFQFSCGPCFEHENCLTYAIFILGMGFIFPLSCISTASYLIVIKLRQVPNFYNLKFEFHKLDSSYPKIKIFHLNLLCPFFWPWWSFAIAVLQVTIIQLWSTLLLVEELAARWRGIIAVKLRLDPTLSILSIVIILSIAQHCNHCWMLSIFMLKLRKVGFFAIFAIFGFENINFEMS